MIDDIYELLQEEPVYCKNADINGTRYFTYYVPITDGSGEFIGAIAIAKSADDVKNRLAKAVTPIIIATSIISIYILFFRLLLRFVFYSPIFIGFIPHNKMQSSAF